MTDQIMTVLGPVETQQLGVVLTHEHILIDQTRYTPEGTLGGVSKNDSLDNSYEVKQVHLTEITKRPNSEPHLSETELRHLRMNPDLIPNMGFIGDPILAIEELSEFRNNGGQTVVDVSNIGLGRDPMALRKISESTGVNIITCCGYYKGAGHPESINQRSIDDVKDEMVRELTVGIADTGIRAGIIGEIGTGQPLYGQTDKWDSTDDPDMGPTEEKVLRAAGRAQLDTGAPVSVHTYNYRPNRLAHHVLDVLKEEGADLEKIVICHLDTRPDSDYVRSIADRGAFVEFDTFGMEIDTEFGVSTRDSKRIALVEETINQGYLEHILLSQDVCRKNLLMCYGGLGYAHISRDIEPRMRHVGISDEKIRTMRVKNPARWLSY